MTRFRVNVFNIAALVSILLLVGYFWLVFLPQFGGSSAYSTVRTGIIVLTILLLTAAGIQFYLAIIKETGTENQAN